MNQPLAKQAYSKIIEMILGGVLAPGDALQEAKLGETLDMSRTPVREAIKRIEAEGLAAQEGRFLRVRQLTRAEVEEIFFLRRILETYCAHRAAGAMATAKLDRLEGRIRKLQEKGPGDGDEQRDTDDEFHQSIAATTGNVTLVRLIDDLRRRTCMFDYIQVPQRFLKGSQEHLEMIAAFRSGDGETAARLMGEHIDHARDAILAKLDASLEDER
ncbi:GntR family transcriptional regulator [Rhizobiaceae bacterium BDR2-2]|uniref:GntR family transcriptional regulator n=1 Tax=Ectorhizobium quercum TaxID=2965071 RepID=A0AAE3SVQ4_9HYPH|nr:GntR family transcriptional regulator [Ectorhizobium quercum]MCX8998377.1 GntR family transcriptional regulator [Ectorhizobium quercum]